MEWPVKTLGDVCIVERGSSPRPIQDFQTDSEDGVNWIKIGDTKGVTKYLTNTKEKITREGAKKSRLVEKGDFILSNSMSFGKPYIMATSGYIHDGWFALRLPEDIDPDFFYHLLSSPLVQDQFQSLSSGAIVKNISGDLVKKTRLPIPPISEQKRIVAILDQVFSDIEQARAKTEQNLKNARELFESYLQQVFSELGDDCDIRSMSDSSMLTMIDGDRGQNYPKKSEFQTEGHCLFLSTKNVRPDGFLFNDVVFINERRDSLLRKGKLERNDVVITTRGTIGNLALFDESVSYTNIRINSGMLILRPNINTVLPSYLFEIMRSAIVKRQIDEKVSGAAQPQLPVNTLETFSFPVPKSLEDQRQVVNKIKVLEKSIAELTKIYNNKLSSIDELKKSILQQAFTGQLTHKKSKGVAA